MAGWARVGDVIALLVGPQKLREVFIIGCDTNLCDLLSPLLLRPTTMATPVIVASTRTVWGAVIVVRCGTGPHIPHGGGAVALARYCPHSRMPVPATPRSKVVRQHSRRRV